MDFSFGKYLWNPIATVLLNDPSYILWMSHQKSMTRPFSEAVREIGKLLERFDQKPFIVACGSEGCTQNATLCTVYLGNDQAMFWCERCNPVKGIAPNPKLVVVRSYMDAVSYVEGPCNSRKESMRSLIGSLAAAKGLPRRQREYTEFEADMFFV